MKEIAISTKGLTKVYQGKVLANDNISLDIYQGEIFGLLGPNGAGKTTFVRQILGLLLPTSGSIKVQGIDVVREPEKIKTLINYMGQNPYALWHLTVEEAIFYTAYLRGTSKESARARTQSLLNRLGLKEYQKKLLGELSGGILKLCNFAMAMVAESSILVLDEPTAGLDPINKKVVWEMIFNLNKEKRVTIILVTHDVLEAEKVLERVGFINHSKIIALGTPGELKREVDDRLRIELVLKPDYYLSEAIRESLEKYGDLVEVHKNHLIIFPPKKEVLKSVEGINNFLGFGVIDDLRLTTTSLEDVYIKLGGEKIA